MFTRKSRKTLVFGIFRRKFVFEIFFWLDYYSWGAGGGGGIYIPTCSSSLTSSMIAGLKGACSPLSISSILPISLFPFEFVC